MRPLFTLPISPALLKDLGKAGYFYVEDITRENGGTLTSILNEHSLTFEELILLWKPGEIATAHELALINASTDKSLLSIPTFSQSVDEVLGGGVPVGSLTQICGSPDSGKTQLTLQLCVNVQIPVCIGGLNGSAIFIDTESTFTLSRIKEMAYHTWRQCRHVANIYNLQDALQDFNVDSLLKNVHFLPALDYLELFVVVQSLSDFLSTNAQVKILILDSIALPFLAIDDYSDRTRLLHRLVKDLLALAKRFKIAVVVTNHLTTRFHNAKKCLTPALGATLTHIIPYTVMLTKRGRRYSAEVENSAEHSKKMAYFSITEEGIRDIEARP